MFDADHDVVEVLNATCVIHGRDELLLDRPQLHGQKE